MAGQEGMDGLYASSVWDAATGEVIVKVANTSRQPQSIQLNLLGVEGQPTAQTLTLSYNGSYDDENTLDQPERITPKAGSVSTEAGKKMAVLNDQLPAMSFRVYKIKK